MLSSNSRRSSGSPQSELDDYSLPELSFEYVRDDDGEIVRTSKGSSKSIASAPVPASDEPPDTSPPVRPAELSRSEGATSVPTTLTVSLDNEQDVRDRGRGHVRLSSATANVKARSFQRVASGPAISHSALPTGASRLPRRATMEDANGSLGATDADPNIQKHHNPDGNFTEDSFELEKENLRTNSTRRPPGRSHSAANVGTVGRIMRSAPSSQAEFGIHRSTYGSQLLSSRTVASTQTNGTQPNFGRISEVDDLEDNFIDRWNSKGDLEKAKDDQHGEGGDTEILESYQEPRPPRRPPLSTNGLERQKTYAGTSSRQGNDEGEENALRNSRSRRSASVGDMNAPNGDLYMNNHHHHDSGYASTSQQSKSRPGTSLGISSNAPKRVIATDESRRRKSEELDGPTEAEHHQGRYSPAPNGAAPTRSSNHKRRESDTVRSFAPSQSQSNLHASSTYYSGSPTAVDHVPARLSPSARNIAAPHRRSPSGRPKSQPASGDEDSPPSVPDRQSRKDRLLQVQQMQQQQNDQKGEEKKQPVLLVNRKQYARLDIIGKGGSSRVFRVLNQNNELYAIKRVSLDKIDRDTMNGYMNEIALLKRLDGNSRIIRLIDSEVKSGPGGSKGYLMLVMECGEIDFAKLLVEQQKQPLNMVWVSYYWQQMLQAVQVIHEEKIVHSDLKPANFVIVKGQLKLIDFGIANAIANDTTNIQRDHTIGTVNYMSPEAIEVPDGMRRLKVGRASDVWSLGCILYQMVYGLPPFSQLSILQRMKAIPDHNYSVNFPDYATPSVPARNSSGGESSSPPKMLEHLKTPVRSDVIRDIKSCLRRPSKERSTIPELLEQDWLAGRDRNSQTQSDKRAELLDSLGDEETLMNTFYMKQLLQYAIALDPIKADLDEEAKRLVQELKPLMSQM